MKTLVRCRLILLVAIWCVAVPASAQEAGARLTPELLQSRIAAAQDSTDLDEPTRGRLIDLYRQSISNLEARRANEEATDEYRRARLAAPAETERIRAILEQRRAQDVGVDLGSLSSKPFQQLARTLDEEIANLTSVEAKLAVLEVRLQTEVQRSAGARTRVAAVRAIMEELAAGAGHRVAPDGSFLMAEAARWAAETRLEALRTEITMLDEELRSYNARTELLKARRDEAANTIDRIALRVEDLRAAVSERRREEAERAMAEARDALKGASSGAPLVRELAQANLNLLELLQEQLMELETLATRERGLPRVSQIDAAYRSAQRKLNLVGSRAPVGMALLAERRQFPNAGKYRTERRSLSRSITSVTLRLTENEEERRALRNVDAYVDGRIEEAGDEALNPEVRGELENLVTTRRSLLDRAIANDVSQQERLHDLDDMLRRLADRTSAYDEFLAQRLLWVRSTRAIDAESFARLRDEVADYLSPGRWLETAREAAVGLVRAPAFLLVALFGLALTWRRGRIRASVVACGQNVGHDHDEGMGSSFNALGFTLMLAAPVPLLLSAIGGALLRANDVAPFPNAVGSALLKTASWIALPIIAHALFLPGGVANRHFGWSDEIVAELRRQLAWFIGLAFPVYFAMRTSLVVEPLDYADGKLTFLCFVVIMTALVALSVGVARPTTGTVRLVLASRSAGALLRWRYIGFPLAVSLPVALIVLGWLGYSYAAQEVMRRLFQTVWWVAAIWLGAALTSRWLALTRRRLERQETLTIPDVASTGRAEPGHADRRDDAPSGKELDVETLSADSHRLLHAIVLLAFALVLGGIWGDVVPALGILDDVGLWDQTVRIDGAQQTVPVTLFDLLVAAVVGVLGYILARNVPSLLDIILLKQGSVSVGARYTVGTLVRYAITAVTVLAVLQRLGASALQLGWAAAALGVGIGFGLQEIVANFICGLILLFERPVRVGDVITIGEASGEVTKIRIRATTIRDWEQKELVVPNKELITGRLLNWTLSNAVTRVFITVGVAYGSDVERAMALIREAAEQNTRVLDEPEPRVHFEQFGDSSLHLTLRAYIGDVFDRLPATTELHHAIDQKFRAAGVVIAFPQRDVHVHAGDDGAAPPIAGGKENGKDCRG